MEEDRHYRVKMVGVGIDADGLQFQVETAAGRALPFKFDEWFVAEDFAWMMNCARHQRQAEFHQQDGGNR